VESSRSLVALLMVCVACSSPSKSERDAGPLANDSSVMDAGTGSEAGASPLALRIDASSDDTQVGEAVVFEGSSSPKAESVTMSWTFGDGGRGGGPSIAHVFAQAGTFEVTLSAIDGEGLLTKATRRIRVSSTAVAGPSLSTKVVVRDRMGASLRGAELVVDEKSAGNSGTGGDLTLMLPSDVPHVLRVKKAGYAEQIRTLTLSSASRAEENVVTITMLQRAKSQSIDVSEGGTVVGADGESLTLAPDSVINAQGQVVSGAIDVTLTSVDVTDEDGVRAFPGEFAGLQTDGRPTGIVSHGTTEFVLEKDGQRLNLAAGHSATIRIPMFAGANLDGSAVKEGSSIPLWSLDERTGGWIQEGSGKVIDLGDGELVLEAEVAHFSWWNADMPFTPSRPKPKCVLLGSDVPGANDYLVNASICKMLIEIDRGVPEAKARRNRRLPGFAALGDVPIQGGQGVAVPADVGLTLGGCILDGLFCGETSVNLKADFDEQAEIRLLPTEDIVPPPEGEGLLITRPYDQSFPFDQATKSDIYRFQAAAGSVTQVVVSGTAAPLSDALNTGTLRLFRGSELIAISAFDGQGNVGRVPAQVTVVAKTAGEYTIEVAWTEQAVIGKYRLRLVPLTVESRTLPLDAQIAPPNYEGWLAYDFDVSAEDRLRFFGWFTLYNQANTTKSSITLLHDDGKRFAASPPAGQDSQYHFGATAAADERLLLVAYYENANPPSSVVALSADAAQPLAVSPAPATTGTLPTYANRSYRFTGSKDQAVKLELTRGYPYSQMDLRLYNPEGQRIAIPVGSGAVSYVIETTLPASGEYLVEVIRGQPVSGDGGAYTLTLEM